MARGAVGRVPKLIPVFSHRYMPVEPRLAGNPLLSVYQTDIIYYGRDLRTYLVHEFGKSSHVEATTPEPRHVSFWSDLVQRINTRAG
jgi:hypothetical protein